MRLEEMRSFFTARVEDYDRHMLEEVQGCAEGYLIMAALIPQKTTRLLDLGCGTGLELEEIFKLFPKLHVTGIDMTKAMTDELQRKFSEHDITIINDSYLGFDFGTAVYDAAVSFETMHHMSHDQKRSLYTNLYHALKPGGVYIECDYMVTDQAEEDFYYAENKRIRKENGIPEDAFYHYDTPCTIDNQIRLFNEAGFHSVQKEWRLENTTILSAKK